MAGDRHRDLGRPARRAHGRPGLATAPRAGASRGRSAGCAFDEPSASRGVTFSSFVRRRTPGQHRIEARGPLRERARASAARGGAGSSWPPAAPSAAPGPRSPGSSAGSAAEARPARRTACLPPAAGAVGAPPRSLEPGAERLELPHCTKSSGSPEVDSHRGRSSASNNPGCPTPRRSRRHHQQPSDRPTSKPAGFRGVRMSWLAFLRGRGSRSPEPCA